MLRAFSLVLCALFLLSGCGTVSSAKAAKGSGMTRLYKENVETVWLAMKDVILNSGLSLVSEDKEHGVILANRGVTAFSYGESVAIFIEPNATKTGTQVEVVNKKALAVNITAKDWEPILIQGLDAKLIGGPQVKPAQKAKPVSDQYANIREISLNTVKSYSVITSQYFKDNGSEKTLQAVQDRIKKDLKDPNSAQFQNLKVVDYLDGKVVCGSVNAKNSYGGYVGYKAFVAGTTGYTYAEVDPKYLDINEAANVALVAACGQ